MSRVDHDGHLTDRSTDTHPTRPRASWLVWSSLALSAAGLAVSAYLTYEHFTDNATLACSIGGAVDCSKVTSSAWSTVVGVPVAVLGLLFFVVMIALCLPRVWRSRAAYLDAARLGWATVGLGMALYLVWAELYRIYAICLWCTGVHVITFVLWAVILFGQILAPPAPDTDHSTD